MRAESLFDGAKDKPLMIVLSRGAPPDTSAASSPSCRAAPWWRLAYWDRGVRAVRAQVGWTRVKTEVQTARDLEEPAIRPKRRPKSKSISPPRRA